MKVATVERTAPQPRAATTQASERTAISLFTGAGGLDLGLEAAGFTVRACVENDPDARKTLTFNRPRWIQCEPGDIHQLSTESIKEQAKLSGLPTLLAAGPPCQPWSRSAYWVRGQTLRMEDPRAKTLRSFLDVVDESQPEVLLLENVDALGFRRKDEGLELLRKGLKKINAKHDTTYIPYEFELNTADFGVPQLRKRLFLVASKIGLPFDPPQPTHGIASKDAPNLKPYVTSWDAIGDLDTEGWSDQLNLKGKWAQLLPSIPEGWNYLWHTTHGGGVPIFGWRTKFWSFLLKLSKKLPSWTLQASPGPATGPFHWRNRLLSIRELCRLQTIPDSFEIQGGYRIAARQVGNAVPPLIGEILGLEIRRQLLGDLRVSVPTLVPKRTLRCPRAAPTKEVAYSYLKQVGAHRDHPGTGLGPGAKRRTSQTSEK